MARTGRRSKLTREVLDAITLSLEDGAWAKDAAAAVCVDERTYHRWRERGEAIIARIEEIEDEDAQDAAYDDLDEVDALHVELIDVISRTRGQVKVAIASKLATSADWKANLEYIKRLDPKGWGDKQHVDVTAKTANADIDATQWSDDELDAFLSEQPESD